MSSWMSGSSLPSQSAGAAPESGARDWGRTQAQALPVPGYAVCVERLGARSNGPKHRERATLLSGAIRHVPPGFRARIGHKARNAFAFPQVAGLRLSVAEIVRAFELCLWPAPPAGFEPAHTAPEGVAAYGADLGKHAPEGDVRTRIGHGQPWFARLGTPRGMTQVSEETARESGWPRSEVTTEACHRPPPVSRCRGAVDARSAVLLLGLLLHTPTKYSTVETSQRKLSREYESEIACRP